MQSSPLDPLSQLIGGLSAQVQALAAQITDLRSDVVTNRSLSQTRWEELTKSIDLVQAEYRNVKHMEREIEQEKIALSLRLKRVDDRLEEIERIILIWRTRFALMLTIGVALGTAAGWLVHTARLFWR